MLDTNNVKDVENHLIEFVISLKKKGMGFVAIRNYVAAVCKYYRMNDVILNTNKINQYLPEFRKSKKIGLIDMKRFIDYWMWQMNVREPLFCCWLRVVCVLVEFQV